MTDGPSINVWDALACAAWTVATVLIVYDAFTYDRDGMGPLTPFGGLVGLAATVLTVAGIARRAKEEILTQMHRAFELGRESVLRQVRH